MNPDFCVIGRRVSLVVVGISCSRKDTTVVIRIIWLLILHDTRNRMYFNDKNHADIQE